MKTSIATVSISGNLHEKLNAIAKAGFDGIEIFEQDFIADTGTPREIGDMIRDHGLEIMLLQPFRDFEGLAGEARLREFTYTAVHHRHLNHGSAFRSAWQGSFDKKIKIFLELDE